MRPRPILASLLALVLVACAGPPAAELQLGGPAADWRFEEPEPGRLSELWRDGPLVLIWLRHYG